MPDLFLYTDSFPYHGSETFLETEILFLSEFFDTIFIQPLNGYGKTRSVPDNVIVLYPPGIKTCSKVSMLTLGVLNFSLLFTEKTFRDGLGQISVFKAVQYLGLGIWIKKRFKRNKTAERSLHYSYWLNYSAFALALMKREGSISGFVSRAHRFDLYAGKGEKALDFAKPFTLSRLNRLFLISENGLQYINQSYPAWGKKYILSRLGSLSPGFTNPINTGEQLILASCSILKPVKRVELILEALVLLHREHPEIALTWFHVGNGDTLEILKQKAKERFENTSINCSFKGHLSNHEVMEFYRNQPIDVFLNVSESEGVPVSIMEAQSCGIPVIATAVGGNPEIVNNRNGFLIELDITPAKLAVVLYKVYTERESWTKKRLHAFDYWNEKYNSEKNYKSFAHDLCELSERMVEESILKAITPA